MTLSDEQLDNLIGRILTSSLLSELSELPGLVQDLQTQVKSGFEKVDCLLDNIASLTLATTIINDNSAR